MRAKRTLTGIGLSVLMGTLFAQATRTPDGMLWAGTTFLLRAVATNASGTPLALSNAAQVSVKQIVRWQWEYESPPYLTVSTPPGWFTLLVRNKGNGVDALRLKHATSESVDTSPWQITLYEQQDENGLFESASPINEQTAPFMPSEIRRLFVRMQPPSDRNTDGVFLTLNAQSVLTNQALPSLGFVAGAETRIWQHTDASTWSNYPLVVPPQLLDGRLFWIASDGTTVRLFSTPQPLSTESTFRNNIRFEANLRGMTPAGGSVVIGNRWYLMSTVGLIAWFDWTQATNGTNVYVQWLYLPRDIVANPNLPLLSDGLRLYYALPNHHLGSYNLDDGTLNILLFVNPSPIVKMQELPNRLIFIGRENGRFDLVGLGQVMVTGTQLNGSGRIVGAALDEWRGNLIVARGNRIGCYNLFNGRWNWVTDTYAPIVSVPATDMTTDAVYVLTQDGWLYAFDLATGSPCLFYPQPLITEAPVVNASLRVVSRTDRKVPYLYVAAQLDAAGTLQTRVFHITATNPFNRFYSTSVVDGAVLGEGLLLTGSNPTDLLLVWCWRGGEGNRGRFYGFRLR
jgi:hypothetical protein